MKELNAKAAKELREDRKDLYDNILTLQTSRFSPPHDNKGGLYLPCV